MKRILFSLISTFLLLSCGKTELKEPIINKENLPNIDTSIFNIIQYTLPLSIRDEPYFLIGYGYDAKENILLLKNELRKQILDNKALESE